MQSVRFQSLRLAFVWGLRIVAAIYFIAAFGIVAARWFVTTQLDSFRDDITATLSNALGVMIEADGVDASFDVIRPVLHLTGVRISRPGGPVSLMLPKVDAEFSWASLLHLEPRFHELDVTGAELTVRRLDSSRWDIAGFEIQHSNDRDAHESAFGARQAFTPWLLEQNSLILRNGHFRFIDERPEAQIDGKPQVIDIRDANLVFVQKFSDWRLAAEARLLERGIERHVQIRTVVEKTFFSDNADPLTWKGRVWAETDHIDLAMLLKRLGLRSPLRSGSGETALWADFDQGRLTQLTMDVAVRGVNARIDPLLQPILLTNLTGRLSFQANRSDAWSFRAEKVAFRTDRGKVFGPTDISADCSIDEGTHMPNACRFSATAIDIGALTSISSAVPLPPDLGKFLREHPLSGNIRDIVIETKNDFRIPENWRFNLVFDKLTLPSGSGMPGFRNLSGTVTSREYGTYDLVLESRIASLAFPGIFRNERMNFDVLRAKSSVRLEPEPTIEIHELLAENRDSAVTARGVWRATGGPGYVDLSGEILRAEATAVPRYLPEAIGRSVLDYLRAAILGGHSPGGKWVLKGDLQNFPWVDANANAGLFRIEADVVNGRYDFLPNLAPNGVRQGEPGSLWPILEDIDAKLIFEGDGMRIVGTTATSAGLSARRIEVEIPHYAEAMLTVRGDIAGDLRDGLAYLQKSVTLRELVGNAFETSRGSGVATAALELLIPLAHPERLRLSLDLGVQQARFAYGHGLPEVTNLSGELRITEKTLSTTLLSGMTASGSLTGSAKLENDVLTMHFQGALNPDEAARIVGVPAALPFFSKLSGTASYQADVVADLAQKTLEVSAKSNMRGMASALPAPLAKTEQAVWPLAFKLAMPLTGSAYDITVDLQEYGHAQLLLRGRTLERAGVGIGRRINLPERGLAVGVKTPKIALTSWLELFQNADETAEAVASMQSSGANTSSPDITRFEVECDELEVFDRPLHNVIGTLRTVGKDRHLRINADEVKGQVEFFAPRPDDPTRWIVKLTQLHVPDAVSRDVSNAIDETTTLTVQLDLPNIDLVIDDLRLGEMLIGKVELAARRNNTSKTWEIENLMIRNPGATLSARGGWSESDNRTRLFARAAVRSTGDVLHSLNVRDVVQDAPGTFTVNLEWAGQPQMFSTNTLNGNIAAHADKGRLVQVEPGAGRLLSLLSMQHLMRRLTLDFSDVVSQGLVFDSLDVQASLENGVLSTPQTTLASSSASIFISGVVDLNHEALDLKAVVLPSLNTEGASLALAVANPIVGLSTFVAQLALKDRLNAFFQQEYHVSGNFDDPIVEKVTGANH